MGKLLDRFIEYLESTTKEQMIEDWKDLEDEFHSNHPTIMDFFEAQGFPIDLEIFKKTEEI